MKGKDKGVLPVQLLGIPAGILIGMGFYIFGYAKGASYLTTDPVACANCHVMRAQFEGWQKASHRFAATCDDCHSPSNVIEKYATKAINGFNHSLAFTTGRYPDEILITPRNHRVTNGACLKCHAEMTLGIRAARHRDSTVSCTGCHRDSGHAH